MATPPRLLTIAGSDSGGGAGIQADLKTFAAHGGYGMSVVTAVTAQNTRAVTAVHEVPPEVVAAQIDAVLGDIGADAVKIGMLSSAGVIRAVADALARHAGPPIVLDPVMVAKSGAVLLAKGAIDTLLEQLLPLATLVTPNLPEAARLTGLAVGTLAERHAAARALQGRGPAVLLKGGHGEGPEDDADVVDLLLAPGEAEPRLWRHQRLATTSTHGTGCTLSAAIAANLGAGLALAESVERGIDYLHGAIAAAFPLGQGSQDAPAHGPVHHLYRLFP